MNRVGESVVIFTALEYATNYYHRRSNLEYSNFFKFYCAHFWINNVWDFNERNLHYYMDIKYRFGFCFSCRNGYKEIRSYGILVVYCRGYRFLI